MTATATETRPDTTIAERVIVIIRDQLDYAISDATADLITCDPASREALALRARREAFAELRDVVLTADLTEYAAANAA